ncbi:MAG: OmpA family protein [Verrucomicrobiota bacterium]
MTGLLMDSPLPTSSYSFSRRYRKKRRSRLSVWILLAVVLSIAVHGVLYLVFAQISVELPKPIEDLLLTAQKFRVEDVTYDKRVLDNPQDLEALSRADEPTPVEPEETLSFETPVVVDLPEEFPLDNADLSPSVDTPSVPFGGAGEPAGINIEAALAASARDSSEALTRELNDRIRSLEAAVSDEQPRISIDSLMENQIDDTAGEAAASLKGKGGDSEIVPEGFTGLDEAFDNPGMKVDPNKPILMPTDLIFGYNEDTLKETAKLSLMKLGVLIMRSPESIFIIEGHTDTTGTAIYNQDLSERRALAVRNWFTQSLDFSADRIARIRVRGMGKSRPIVNPNGTIEEQALNRRVEIKKRPPGHPDLRGTF